MSHWKRWGNLYTDMNQEVRYLLDYILENGYIDSLDYQELEIVMEETHTERHNMQHDTKITAMVALIADRDKCKSQWHWAKISQSIDGETRTELMAYWRDRYIRIRKAKAEISNII